MPATSTSVKNGEEAKALGQTRKRTLAERYALVKEFEASGKTQSEYMFSKGWLKNYRTVRVQVK